MQFQSTLPRRERRLSQSVFCQGFVSIHAPTKGATLHSLQHKHSHSCFNPRSHEGSDGCRRISRNWQQVSIHAPTKGATDTASKHLSKDQSFNPRSHEGSDIGASMITSSCTWFQSTLPRRERLPWDLHGGKRRWFQSTLPRRERLVSPRIRPGG